MVLAVGAVVLLPGTATLPLIDRDEPRFSRATVEMIERGEWVVPYFNEAYRFDKPVLTYWLMRAGYAVAGQGELGARLHAVAAALLVALWLLWTGRRHGRPGAAGVAAVGWLTCVQVLIHGRSAVADMPMVLSVAAALGACYELLHATPARPVRWQMLLSLALAAGFLAKGPIAWLVPLLALLIHRFAFWRKPLPWRRLGLLWGLPLALVLIGAWGIPALVKTGGAFWDVGMEKHVVERGLKSFNGQFVVPVFFYPLAALASLFPWIAWAGRAYPVVRADATPWTRFLLSWLLAPYLIFALYSTQLMHYVLPAFPAFFLLLGDALVVPAPEARGRVWFRIVIGFHLALALVLAVAALAVSWPGPRGGLACALGSLAAVWMGLILLVSSLMPLRRLRMAAALLLVAVGLAGAGGSLQRVSASRHACAVLEQLPPAARARAWRFQEPSLVFYGARTWKWLPDLKEVGRMLRLSGPAAVVLLEKEWKLEAWLPLVGDGKPARDFTADLDALDASGWAVHTVDGLNPARGTWVRLRLLTRADDPM